MSMMMSKYPTRMDWEMRIFIVRLKYDKQFAGTEVGTGR
jgi:hypothetical protein